MILALNTSEAMCHMTLLNTKGDVIASKQWLAERQLAQRLFTELETFLSENKLTFLDLSGLIVFKGPGSFTGLRIGVTVMNTLAYSQTIPVVGEIGDAWIKSGMRRLSENQNDQIVLPEYGRDPRITTPRK